MKIDQTNFRHLDPDDQIRALRGQRLEREFMVERDGIDTGKRTAWLSIASEEPYQRWWGVEILDLGNGSIRDQRLRSGAPLLVGHDTADQVGVIEKFQIARDRKLRILARFGKSARAEEVWQDVLDGIRRNTSVGYVIHDMVLESQQDGVNTYRVTDWEPYEGSLVAVPADPTVGLGRNHNKFSENPNMKNEVDIEHKLRGEQRGGDIEAKRIANLYSAGETFPHNGGRALAREIIEQGGTVEQFNARMLESMRGAQKPTATAAPGGFGDLDIDSRATPSLAYGDGPREILPSPKHFKGPDAEQRAYAAGQWLRGFYGKEDAQRWCRDRGMEIRAMSSATLAAGGALVPDVLAGAIIDNQNSYGRFRENADVWPMSSDNMNVPRSTADPDASFVGESGGLAEDEGDWDTVGLYAKKIGCITRIPTELLEDSAINLADRSAFQISRAFTKKEDDCGFNGTGTSTYGGMRGICTLLVDGQHNAGKVTAASAHDTFGEIDAVDLANLVAACPEYALEGAKWYCSSTAWSLVFMRLMMAGGGNSVTDLSGKVPKMYAGYEVVTSPVLPSGASTDYTGQVMIAFGDLRRCSKFGSRRQIRLQILTERYADLDQIGIMATERFDIVNHDLGNNANAGPMVGLVGGT